MDALYSALWRTCRVRVNEKRRLLLRQLFQFGASNVTRLGAAAGSAGCAGGAGIPFGPCAAGPRSQFINL